MTSVRSNFMTKAFAVAHNVDLQKGIVPINSLIVN